MSDLHNILAMDVQGYVASLNPQQWETIKMSGYTALGMFSAIWLLGKAIMLTTGWKEKSRGGANSADLIAYNVVGGVACVAFFAMGSLHVDRRLSPNPNPAPTSTRYTAMPKSWYFESLQYALPARPESLLLDHYDGAHELGFWMMSYQVVFSAQTRHPNPDLAPEPARLPTSFWPCGCPTSVRFNFSCITS